MARDSQRAKVYAWEAIAYPGYYTERRVTPAAARDLIKMVHQDVLERGGYAASESVIKFTKRAGGACASWGHLNFTPGKITLDLVLHEVAHALTYHGPWLRRVMQRKRAGEALTPIDQHAADRLCDQGHGPRYVACFMALMERYANFPASKAMQTARFFTFKGWGPWATLTETMADGGVRYMRRRTKVTKHGVVKVDPQALAYWRALLNTIPGA